MGRIARKGRTSAITQARWPEYGISLNESRHAADFTMETIRRPYLKLFYVVEGRTLLRADGAAVRIDAKHCVAVAKETPHRLEDPGSREVTLFILSVRDQAFAEGSRERALLDSLNADKGLSHHVLSPLTDAGFDLAQAFRIIRREQMEGKEDEALAVKSIVTALLVGLHRARADGGRPDKAVSDGAGEMAAYIRRNFSEPVTVSAMAALCNMPVNRFILDFKKRHNMTPLRYLHRARIDYAKKRLSGSGDSIAAVCFEAGFNDLSFFYRVFRKFTGKSPRAYRQG